ncbi:Mitotic checkpoint protein BUB3.2 [Golovinomyces cichoracearum]|uniref:Mitotic checkpoint protein BUB3.2 n=1 Tax=Golovinomyces cichoracearum TaxID=62708 RepID=A0A420I913_9PEZI|nr:Mitotic checkpoint protein BUB3.2 [Golovinomyces cichoracearum]
MAPALQFELSQPPTDAISSLAFASGTPTRLLVASWDKHVYLYDTSDHEARGTLIQKFEHRAPVLDVCFGASDNEAFTGGVDFQVKRINLQNGEQTVVGAHRAPVKSVVHSKDHSLLFSASWDSTLQIYDLENLNRDATKINLPAKPHSMSVTTTKLVVAMASRLVHIYEISTIKSALADADSSTSEIEPWQQRESSLKFMTRSVACMPSDAGYACSSIEGRIAVEWFDPSVDSQARKYAFKCHRQADSEGNGIDIVYPVNAVEFHPIFGTFASGGGDGIVALWDAEAKRRIRQYQKYPAAIAALSFSCDGNYLAIGVCPGYEDGQESYSGEGSTHVFIRELGPNEAKGKRSK